MTHEDIALLLAALPAALDEIERLRAAWRTVNLPEEHPEKCKWTDFVLPYIRCTCGLHARKAAAREVLAALEKEKADG